MQLPDRALPASPASSGTALRINHQPQAG